VQRETAAGRTHLTQDYETQGTGRRASRLVMKSLAIVVAAGTLAMAVAVGAAPRAREVERAMSQGNWQKADAELAQVLQAHPGSAHAHYLYGQVLEREGRPADALAELEKARALDPQLRFARDPSRFTTIESRVQAEVRHADPNSGSAGVPASVTSRLAPHAAATPHAIVSASQGSRGPSIGMWIGLALVLAGIGLVVRWTLRRARLNDDVRADDQRRAQLKRVTDLLIAVRALKLDVRLSVAPGHEALEKEAGDVETQLCELADVLSNGSNPVPGYRLEELGQRIDGLRARTEGRPDPNAATTGPGTPAGPGGGPSPYAKETERFGHHPESGPAEQPAVVVEQPGGWMGGLGSLVSGMLLGQMLGGRRDRVIEREVWGDGGRRHSGDAGVDAGQGSDSLNDNSGGSADIDTGISDDWSNGS
jgi:Tetratricopeptide repeat